MSNEVNMNASRAATQSQLASVCPIKTMLVPVAGSETDRVVLSLALRLARPLQAHLEFLHLRVGPEEVAARAKELALYGSMPEVLNQLQCGQMDVATSAINYVQRFCSEHGIPQPALPNSATGVTANYLEETGPATETLLFHARHSDLVIVGRSYHLDLMPKALIEKLLAESGRPLLIASREPSPDLLDTVVVGWKETPEAARAVSAALPILKLARHVVLVNVAESSNIGLSGLEHLSAQLVWHGIAAEVRTVGDGLAPAAALLKEVATDLNAGLLVVGGFGHGRLRETVFGGVTRSLIDGASLPVFMIH